MIEPKVGDLVKIVKNDMSLAMAMGRMKDDRFYNQVGTVLSVREEMASFSLNMFRWYEVLINGEIYEVRYDAIEVIN